MNCTECLDYIQCQHTGDKMCERDKTKNMEECRTVGYFIKAALERRDWTQQILSEITGISTAQISNIIKGKNRLTAENAYKISKALDISPYYLLEVDTKYRLMILTERENI